MILCFKNISLQLARLWNENTLVQNWPDMGETRKTWS